MPYIFIALTLIVAIGGTLSKESQKRYRWFLLVVLVSSAGVQVWIEIDDSKKEAEYRMRLHESNAKNDTLIQQNQNLLLANTDLLGEVRQYQDEIDSLREMTATNRDYQYFSQLSGNGVQVYGNGAVVLSTDISEFISPALERVEGGMMAKCNDTCIQTLQRLIDIEPNFPFSYYFLAVCLYDSGDSGWKRYAERAIDMFEKTTSLSGHHRDHDAALAHLKAMLRKGS
ncbi:hypothetical protein GF377_07660 [candidate division GN15 bacterium]|nr:hypothetical protein [candidate division GN15 bacterium]